MHTPVRVLVGSLGLGLLPSLGAGPAAGTILLDLGVDHPSHAGLLELQLWTEDEVISRAELVVGAMHRGVEKLFEVRDYRQILMLADRHDWQAPFFGELVVALACEDLLGVEVPERAVWLRTLLAEHTRVLSHCGFLGYLSSQLEVPNPLAGLREALRGQTQRLTGNRIHPMVNRVGGLSADADAAWLAAEAELAAQIRSAGVALTALLAEDDAVALLRGRAVLDRATVAAYGVTGPAARASGVDLDRRWQQPYLAYASLTRAAAGSPRPEGDALARFGVLADEVIDSATLIEVCAARLADVRGPVAVRLGKIVKLPEGETYRAVEAPLGVAGAFLVSRGEKTPWRLKLRTPSFNNVAALEALLVGVRLDALAVTLASIGYVVGDIDR